MTLRDTIHEFRINGKGIGHFNISDSNQLQAVADAAKSTGLPVVIGLSEGEREFFPLEQARAIINIYQAQGVHVFLSADHTYSLEKAKAAIDAGVDAIVVDGAKLPFEENVALVKDVVIYARMSGRDVLVEGELGYIGTSSKILDKLPEGAAVTEELMTKPEEVARFIEETHADLMAPAVGNVHGMIKTGQPKLSITRIKALAEAQSAPLVLHGGSGSYDAEFVAAIAAGVAIIHINTELRVLYRDTLRVSLANEEEVAPYRFLAPSVQAMTEYVAARQRLFAGVK